MKEMKRNSGVWTRIEWASTAANQKLCNGGRTFGPVMKDYAVKVLEDSILEGATAGNDTACHDSSLEGRA